MLPIEAHLIISKWCSSATRVQSVESANNVSLCTCMSSECQSVPPAPGQEERYLRVVACQFVFTDSLYVMNALCVEVSESLFTHWCALTTVSSSVHVLISHCIIISAVLSEVLSSSLCVQPVSMMQIHYDPSSCLSAWCVTSSLVDLLWPLVDQYDFRNPLMLSLIHI